MSGGSLATGARGMAVSTNISGSGLDPAQQKLLEAIGDLRARLGQHARGAEDETLDSELSQAAGEITQNGRAEHGLLRRLLARLATYGPATATTTATAASVTAVIQAIAAVLSG